MTVTSRLVLPLPQSADLMSVNPPAFATIWQNVDPAIGPTFCTSSTRPASPYACQWIFETDTFHHLIWNPVSSAWDQIAMNPTGLTAINQTVAQTNIPSQNTNYLCASIAPFSVEQGKNYLIHVAGVYGFTNNAGNTGIQTGGAAKASIVANAANGSTTTVTAGSTALQSQYVDAWGAGGGTPAHRSFHFEVPWSSGNNTQLSVGWIINVPTFNTSCSGFYAKSSLIYVEQQ